MPQTGYCTQDDLLLYGWQSGQNDSQFFDKVMPRIRDAIDTYLGVPSGHFYKAEAGAVASARNFYGSGQDYLLVDPFTTISSVTMPTGQTVPSYIECKPNDARSRGLGSKVQFYLRKLYKNGDSLTPVRGETLGWPDGVRVTVTAVWGWSATPPAIVEAAAETCIATWRGRDAGYVKAVLLDSNTVLAATAFPPRAKQILDSLKASAMTLKFA